MTNDEQKVCLDQMLEILTEIKEHYEKLELEAREKAECYQEEAKRHLIESKTIQAVIVALDLSLKELKEKGE